MKVEITKKITNPFNFDLLKIFRNKTPFFVFSKKKLISNINKYKTLLPNGTEICYAMKSNSETQVLEVMHNEGISFEVASKYELSFLKKINVSPKNIIYGTSVKPVDHIKEFVKYGVDRFAFDSEEELLKLATHAPCSRVYVRALVDDKSDSVFHMSDKFGAPLKDIPKLLLHAKELGLVPYGISFNVGSQARNAQSWARGISDVIGLMKLLMIHNIKIESVNLGGGFPFDYEENNEIPKLELVSKNIGLAMKDLPYPVNFIAEPGRGLVADTFLLVTSVVGKNDRANGSWLYLDAGVYNALLEALTCQGSTRYKIIPMQKNKAIGSKIFIVTGPTGDNLDVINPAAELPENMEIGDKIIICDVGAYTFPLMTKFNGFPKPKILDY